MFTQFFRLARTSNRNAGSSNGASTRRSAALSRAAIIFAFIGVASGLNAAYAQESFHYRFQLQGVTDPGSAKGVTDLLRSVFNAPEEPFKVYPTFNDETDTFEFDCEKAVTKDYLTVTLFKEGIVLQSFEMVMKATRNPEER